MPDHTVQDPSARPRARRLSRRRVGLAVVVASLLGVTGVAYAGHTPFPDAQSGFYHEAVGWAAQNQLTDGYGDSGLFRPELNVTRGEVVTFLHRYHNQMASRTDTLTAFVSGNGALANGVGATAAARRNLPTGEYIVTFDRDIGGCWYTVTPRIASPRSATVSTVTDTTRIVVNTFNQDGLRADTAFHVAVTCPAP